MSPTMTLTVASPPLTPQASDSFTSGQKPQTRCPNCGSDPALKSEAEAALAKAQSHISDLEVQVRQLNEKATDAIYRCAAYEDELARLRNLHSPPLARASAASSPQHSPLTSRSPSAPKNSPPTSGFFLPSSQRLSSLLSPRKSTPNLRADGAESTEDLAAALAREKALRAEAEETVRRTGEEAEELSAAVFEKANEMVANERRERAALEERVRVLEEREKGRGRRLDVLEAAVQRMEKVRALFEQEREREREAQRERERGVQEARERGREGEARLLGDPFSPGRPTSNQIIHLGSPPLQDGKLGE
ncbi:hypothetical protein VUR80DRAFT_7230 [Thermomyces stellatus]